MINEFGARLSRQLYEGARRADTARADVREVTTAMFDKKVNDGEWEAETDVNRFGTVQIRITDDGARETIRIKDHRADAQDTCPVCDGKGEVRSNGRLDKCEKCDGSGKVKARGDASINIHAAVDSMVEQLNSLGKGAAGLVERATRGDAVDHLRHAAECAQKAEQHRVISRGRGLHMVAYKDYMTAKNFHEKAHAATGTKDYLPWATEASKAEVAADRMSARANAEEPDGPVRNTPQVKW